MNAAAQFYSQQQLDDLRQRISLSGVIGQVVTLKRSGREYSGLCPFHQERTGSFTVSDDKGFYHCFGCGAHGDVIRFVMEYRGAPFLEAVQALCDECGIRMGGDNPATPPQQMSQRSAARGFVDSLTVAQHIWTTAQPAAGEIVEDWLAFRGLDVGSDNVRGAIARLRYHPRCPVNPWRTWETAEDAWMTHPAMVALIERIGGERGERTREAIGVHCTYLAPNGRGKAALGADKEGRPRATRKMWGSISGGAVMLSDIDPPADDVLGSPLVNGEGIETTLSAMDLQPGPVRGAASLSLNNLQGGVLRGPHGELPIWNMRPDPERPPFLFSDPGPVIVAVDADMKPITGPQDKGVKVQEGRGQRYVLRPITGLERAEMCAALAVKAWRSTGAYPVTAIRPPVGMDFNDTMRRTG